MESSERTSIAAYEDGVFRRLHTPYVNLEGVVKSSKCTIMANSEDDRWDG